MRKGVETMEGRIVSTIESLSQACPPTSNYATRSFQLRLVGEHDLLCSNLELDIEVLYQFLVAVPDCDLGHTSDLSDLALGPALAAQNASDVDD